MAQQNWQTLYRAALAEANPAEQGKKIDLANGAIHHRLYELANEQVNASEEQQAIVDALQTMQSPQGPGSTPSGIQTGFAALKHADVQGEPHETHVP